MEVCGNIFTNTDYTQFYLKCIYCTVEIELSAWQKFSTHIQNSHFTGQNASPVAEPIEDQEFLDEEFDVVIKEDDIKDVEVAESEEVSAYEKYDETMEEFLGDVEYLEESSMDGVVSEEPSTYDKDVPSGSKLNITIDQINPLALHFIELYKELACLWNCSDPNYGIKKARSEAHRSLIEKMKSTANILMTEKEVKSTIQQLHEQYSSIYQISTNNSLDDMQQNFLTNCEFLNKAVLNMNAHDANDAEVIKLNFNEKNAFTIQFIETYSNYPELYDPKSEDYKSVEIRQIAYAKMAEDLSFAVTANETDIYIAVVKLRKWFYQAIGRAKSSSKTSDDTKSLTKIELYYLQICNFLTPTKTGINCAHCGKRYPMDYGLRNHLHKQHGIGELPYLCNKCPRRFENQCDMERHKLRQHSVKMHKCNYCDSTFAVVHDLKAHTRVHTGEKPYICELCGKAFRLNLLLNYHINGRHLNLRPYKCEICSKDYRKRVELRDHMKVHYNIRDKKCNICGKQFSKSCSLSRHRKIHRKESKSGSPEKSS